MIKILIGGSPCTYWSIAQKNNRETEPSGLGWELFKNYLIAKEKFKPDFFLYENNKSAAQAIKDQIKKELKVYDGTLLMEDTGARYIEINSALVSAQNRQRFYVHNCGEVEQPEDRGILLRDILESGVTDREKARAVIGSAGRTTEREYFMKHQGNMCAEPINICQDGKSHIIKAQYFKNGIANFITNGGHAATGVAEPIRIPPYGNDDKSRPIRASYAYKGAGVGSLQSECFPDNPNKQVSDYIAEPVLFQTPRGKNNGGCKYEKTPTLTANAAWQENNRIIEPVRVGALPRSNGELSTSQAMRIYSVDGKSVTQSAGGGGMGSKTGLDAIKADGSQQPVYEVKDGLITIKGKQYPIKLADGFYIIRKLTVTECARLQTMPDDYCRAVSDTQAYKGLGNGWTAEVIIHILNGALKNVPKDEEIIVLSMYDGIGTGRYCLDKMGFTNVKYFAYEIDKYAKQIAMSNYPDIIQMGDAFQLRYPDWTIGY